MPRHTVKSPVLPPLPLMDGPRLAPFNDGEPVTILEFLDLIWPAGHSSVWKVKIDGEVYDLKAVGFAAPFSEHLTRVSDASQFKLAGSPYEKEFWAPSGISRQVYNDSMEWFAS